MPPFISLFLCDKGGLHVIGDELFSLEPRLILEMEESALISPLCGKNLANVISLPFLASGSVTCEDG